MKFCGLNLLIGPRICTSPVYCVSFVLLLLPNFCIAQNTHILAGKWDVRWTAASVEEIRIPNLPLMDYPLLGKFRQLRDVSFYWEGADDAKLIAFSKLNFTNLQQISLLDCPKVTDEGIRAIAQIHSLRGLNLEGTSITDAGLEVVATKMQLDGVNVASCTNVTRTGVQALVRCRTIKELSFSADTWTEPQVVELIDSFESVKWCGIIDSQSRLSTSMLKARGRAKGVTIVVMPSGALQNGRNYRKASSPHN